MMLRGRRRFVRFRAHNDGELEAMRRNRDLLINSGDYLLFDEGNDKLGKYCRLVLKPKTTSTPPTPSTDTRIEEVTIDTIKRLRDTGEGRAAWELLEARKDFLKRAREEDYKAVQRQTMRVCNFITKQKKLAKLALNPEPPKEEMVDAIDKNAKRIAQNRECQKKVACQKKSRRFVRAVWTTTQSGKLLLRGLRRQNKKKER